MSKRSNRSRLRAQFKGKLGQRELEPIRFRAVQGDGAGTVKVSGKRNYIFVRRVGRSRIEECLNTKAPIRNNLPVIVGYSHEMPGLLQVLETDWEAMAELGEYPYVPFHHESHEFQNTEGGDDVVWVQKQQFLPLLCYPTDPPSMQVNVMSDWYTWDTGWHYFEGALSADLTGYIPAAGGKACYVLISVDRATETLQYTVGAEFSAFLPPLDMESMVPTPPAGSVPSAAICLINGAMEIDWDDIYDIRLFGSMVAGSVSPGLHNLLDPSVHDDTSFDDPTQGSLIYGNPPTGTVSQWDEFPIGVTGSYLRSTGELPLWDTLPAMGAHNLLDGSVHPDTAVDSPTWGSLIVGGAPTGTGSVWDEFLIGATGTYLRSDGDYPHWVSVTPGAAKLQMPIAFSWMRC